MHTAYLYLLLVTNAAIVVALIFLPSVFISVLWERAIKVTPTSPILGICLLAAIGLAFWKSPASAIHVLAGVVSFFYFSMAIATAVIFFRQKTPRQADQDSKFAFIAVGLVLIQCLAIGTNPLPIVQEFNPGSPQPGRMVASPPDHGIPYGTADYFRNGYDGKEKSTETFGEWGIGARGPLVPLAINGLFGLFDFPLTSPGGQNDWPIASRGEHLASILGWVTNCLVVLGVYQLASTLTQDKRRIEMAVVWTALSPVVLINTVFTWPKLLAAYFLLVAVSYILQRRMWAAGFVTALAWLSHPIGALMIPGLGIYSVLRSQRFSDNAGLNSAFRFCFPAALAGGLTMAPWIAFKWWVGLPDPFANYLFGMGRGMLHAQTAIEWLDPRISNLVYTLTPFKFSLDGQMAMWVYGPVTSMTRWLIQYAKTLPGHLGYSLFLFAYFTAISRQRVEGDRAFLWSLIIAALTVMIIFWGFSGDGLGRNCLEVLSIFAIVYASVFGRKNECVYKYGLIALAFENIFIAIAQFVADGRFSTDAITTASAICFLTSIVATFLLVTIFNRLHAHRERRHQDKMFVPVTDPEAPFYGPFVH